MDFNNIWNIVDSLRVDNNVNKINLDDCIECIDGGNIVKDQTAGCYVCLCCGLTKQETIIVDTDEIHYSDSNKPNPSRIGAPMNSLYPSSSLSTMVSGNSKISKMNSWLSMPYSEKVIWKVSQDLKSRASIYSINDSIISNAITMFKEIDDKKKCDGKKEIHRGRVRSGIIAACLYYAFRAQKVVRSPSEVADIMDLDLVDVTRGCKLFLDIMRGGKSDIHIISDDSNDFVSRFCSNLNLNFSYIKEIKSLLNEVTKYKILNKNTPISRVAGCIFYVITINKLDINKKNVSKACNVSDVTVSKTYKKICLYKDLMNLKLNQ